MKEHVTSPAALDARKRRRAALRAAGRCINGPFAGDVGRWGVAHTAPVPKSGGRCQRCLDVKRKGAPS